VDKAIKNSELSIGFIHIPKCAGTSVWGALKSVFKPEQLCDTRHDGVLETGYRAYAGHFAAKRLAPLDLDWQFTIFRDPFDRLVSAYRFLKSHSQDFAQANDFDLALLARRVSFENFCANPMVSGSPFFNNPYVNILCRDEMPMRWEKKAPKNLFGPNASVSVTSAIDQLSALNIAVYHFDDLDILAKDMSKWLGQDIALEHQNVTDKRPVGDDRFDPVVSKSYFSDRREALLSDVSVKTLLEQDVRLIEALRKPKPPIDA
jgi:hypothetical protein